MKFAVPWGALSSPQLCTASKLSSRAHRSPEEKMFMKRYMYTSPLLNVWGVEVVRERGGEEGARERSEKARAKG